MSRTSSLRKQQGGAAIVTAMLTVALVATLAAGSLWQQWRSIEIESAQRGRAQAAWILVGALDWGRLILREDARTSPYDHLAEPWAVPLEEAKLATFFAAQGSSTDDKDIIQAYLSGRITDMQSRLNLRNLVDNGRVSLVALRQFGKLFDLLGLPEAELNRFAENLRFALDTSADNQNANRAPLLPQRYAQLGWLGLSPKTLTGLQNFATWLPERTPVNLNTAPAEVIYASIAEDDMALARRLVTARGLSHFKSLAEAEKMLRDVPGQLAEGQHSVASRYFEVQGQLRLDDLLVRERSLVVRDANEVKTLWRERMTPHLTAAALPTMAINPNLKP